MKEDKLIAQFIIAPGLPDINHKPLQKFKLNIRKKKTVQDFKFTSKFLKEQATLREWLFFLE